MDCSCDPYRTPAEIVTNFLWVAQKKQKRFKKKIIRTSMMDVWWCYSGLTLMKAWQTDLKCWEILSKKAKQLNFCMYLMIGWSGKTTLQDTGIIRFRNFGKLTLEIWQARLLISKGILQDSVDVLSRILNISYLQFWGNIRVYYVRQRIRREKKQWFYWSLTENQAFR